jgi:hypothetical protein
MAQTTAVITQALPSVAGSVDFTSSGFGTPTAAIIFFGDANTTLNPQNGAGIGVGFWDGTNVCTMSAWTQDGAASTVAKRLARTDLAVALVGGSTTMSCSYTISNITDGVRLTLSADNTDLDRYATVILVAGVSAKVLSLTTNPTVDTGTASASLGFAPNLILTTCIGFTGQTPNSGTTQTNTANLSFGLASSDGTHRMTAWAVQNATSSDVCSSYFSELYCAGQLSSTAIDYGIEVTNWGADDFTATTRIAGSGSDLIYVLALGGADLSFAAGTITAPLTTGAVDTTTTGIDPSAVLFGLLTNTAADAVATANAQASAVSVGAASSSVNAGYAAISEDALSAATNSAAEYSGTNALLLLKSTAGVTADVLTADVTPGTGKFTVDYSLVSATLAYKGWYLAFGPAGGGGFKAAWARGCNTVISSGAGP